VTALPPRPDGGGRPRERGPLVPRARLSGIVRRFGTLRALDGADLEVRGGEVHAVLGENGAGKSTLLAILGGMQRPDAGRVEIDGRVVELASPRDAWDHGVGLVHQHFALVPTLSVMENLALGRRAGMVGWRLRSGALRAEAEELMGRTGLVVSLEARVERLGVGERQRVEILKALLRDPPLLALDEPTATLMPDEVDQLFGLLRDFAEAGRAVVLVAHKIDEVLRVADRVTVLRRGRTALSAPRGVVDAPGLVDAMIGDDLHDGAAVGWWQRRSAKRDGGDGRPAPGRDSEAVAVLEDVSIRPSSGPPVLDGASLAVRRGEIVGIAGVEGNGQRELALVLAGRSSPDDGTAGLPAGIGFVPPDRMLEGLIGDFDLAENVALSLHEDPVFRRGPFLRWDAIRARTEQIRARFDVRAASVDARARTLSGGNQQRLVVGRELALATDLLVAENPTRGLDVGATAFVHDELRRLTRSEPAPGVVLLSTDLDEILELSDRVLVMSRGRLLAPASAHPTREEVGALMLGGAR